MAEQLVNEFTVNRPIDEAWAVITDVERIAPCLPGAQLQEIEGDVYRGVVKVKLGSITPSFKGQATFIDRDDQGHRAVLKAEGRDTGGRGNAAAEITAQAESLSPTSTRCVVTTTLVLVGERLSAWAVISAAALPRPPVSRPSALSTARYASSSRSMNVACPLNWGEIEPSLTLTTPR